MRDIYDAQHFSDYFKRLDSDEILQEFDKLVDIWKAGNADDHTLMALKAIWFEMDSRLDLL